jgi:hypothetical protein
MTSRQKILLSVIPNTKNFAKAAGALIGISSIISGCATTAGATETLSAISAYHRNWIHSIRQQSTPSDGRTEILADYQVSEMNLKWLKTR